MPYEHNLSKPFIAPIFIEEDGYWQNCMKPYLEREGGISQRLIALEPLDHWNLGVGF